MSLTTSLADLSVLLVEPSSMQAHLVQRMLENQGVKQVTHVDSASASPASPPACAAKAWSGWPPGCPLAAIVRSFPFVPE